MAALDAQCYSVGDQIFNLCSLCKALFTNHDVFSQHRPLCDGDPAKAQCDFFACPKQDYLMMLSLNVPKNQWKKPAVRQRKRRLVKQMSDEDAAKVRKVQSIEDSQNEAPEAAVVSNSDCVRIMRRSARRALKKFTELSDEEEGSKEMSEMSQTGQKMIEALSVLRKTNKARRDSQRQMFVIPNNVKALIAAARLDLKAKGATETGSDRNIPTCSISLQDSCNLPVTAIVSENQLIYSCHVCEYKTEFFGHMVRHSRSHNSDGALLQCDQCEFRTSLKRVFQKHMREKHVKSLICNHCTFQCSTAASLKVHALVHTGEKPFVCEQCGYSCRQKNQLICHLRKHSGDMLHCAVEGCTFTTVYDWALRNHQANHNPVKRYCCKQCAYRTNDRSAHLRHQKMHNKVKPHRCPECKYSAMTKYEVTKHVRTHTQEKVYFCNKCSYSTAHAGSLRSHLMVHQNLKPFVCSVCEYASTGKAKVQRHIDKQHKGEGVVYKDLAANLGDVKMSQFKAKGGGTKTGADTVASVDENVIQEESHEITLMYKCSSCELLFPSIEAFNMHLKNCQGKVKTAAESIISLGQQ